MKHFLFFILPVMLSFSCISKKKHLEQMGSLEDKYESQVGDLSENLAMANRNINELQLNLAERRGENNALTSMQDKLLARIDELEDQIEQLKQQAENREQSMDQMLQSRMVELEEQKQLLQEVKNTLNTRKESLLNIAREAEAALSESDSLLYSVNVLATGEVSINLLEDLVFRPGSTSRLQTEGEKALENLSEVFTRYPIVDIWIIGHTDNRPVPRQSLDNWQYSALRATTVAELLIDDFNLNPNQVTPAAKSEFAPRASNETPEGREMNRRVELLVRINSSELIRDLRRKIERS